MSDIRVRAPRRPSDGRVDQRWTQSMTATTSIRCDRCDAAYLHLEPAAVSRVYADNAAREAGWTVNDGGLCGPPLSIHVCPRCSRPPAVA